MRDLYNNLASDLRNVKGPVRAGASGSVVADLRGYDSAVAFIKLEGTGATFAAANLIRFSLLHGDTSTTATGAVGTADVSGVTPVAGVVKTLNTSTAAAAGTTKIHYDGGKRYLRLRWVASGSASGATGFTGTRANVGILKGNPEKAPIA